MFCKKFWQPPCINPPLPLLLCPLEVSIKIILPVSPLAIVRLQIQSRIVSAGGVADVVLREPVLVLPPLHRLLAAHLRDGEVLLPVVGPVQFTWGRLTSSDMLMNILID